MKNLSLVKLDNVTVFVKFQVNSADTENAPCENRFMACAPVLRYRYTILILSLETWKKFITESVTRTPMNYFKMHSLYSCTAIEHCC